MIEFIDMSVGGRYLFPPSTLPLTNLLLKSNAQALESLFSFHSLQIEAETNQFRLTGSMGEFEKIPIPQLLIDPVSINLGVVGNSADLKKIYEELRSFLIKIDPKKRMENPTLYASTFQTQSTVRLPIPHAALLSKELSAFLASEKGRLKPQGCSSAEIRLSNLSFQVNYTSCSDLFSFMPKPLTIEPRAGANPEENVYFIVTPTDSAIHQRMIEGFIKAMSTKSAEAKDKSRPRRIISDL